MTKILDENGLVQLVAGLKDYLETRFDNVFKRRILEANNPVGTVREFFVPTNPATLLGFGTWTQIASGRTLVGVDTTDTAFNYAGKIGGEKTHKLTVAELAEHGHELKGCLTGEDLAAYNTGNHWGQTYEAWKSDKWITKTGGNQPHNNLQPYYCVYIWRRTA